MKAVGSAYLFWLAAKTVLAGPPLPAKAVGEAPINLASGALLLLINPKTWAMALGAASSFSKLVSNPLTLGAILAVVFALSACSSLMIWVLADGLIAQSLSADWHLFNGIMAILPAASVVKYWV
ncbi:hypothetical protein [uncultured Ruegeria sp.]|uniref:hypothetical protein n=1 Tax=uncultured Ruegeria sp. TaxID=259304 RepID=UPI00262ABC5D|nr:hypothetical protein [uncultured Ruegeria sp.]